MKLFEMLAARPLVLLLSLSFALLLFSSQSQAASPLPGWPVQTGALAWGPITMADVDGDGVAEAVTVSDKIYVLKGDGTPLPGWPIGLPYDINHQSEPVVAVGDLDGNGEQVVVVAGDNNIYAWNPDGTLKDGFPIQAIGPDEDFGLANITLADLDGDGTLEIITVSNWLGKVFVWRHDGTPAPGWPVLMPPADWAWSQMTPAVGDLDGDGKLELIVPAVEDKVYAWHYDGTPVAGWPQSVGYPMYVATGDFAHEGTAKVIVSTANDTIVAFNGDGSPIAGWPKDGGMAAIGDIDGDGDLDIVTDDGGGKVYAYRIDGSILPGWPQSHGDSLYQGPVLGDVDGDGGIDVLYRAANSIYGWRADGTLLPDFPIRVGSSNLNIFDGSLALGDINGDGIVDVVTGSAAEDTNIYAFGLSGQYRRQYLPWPMCSHDPQQTAQQVAPPVIVWSSFSGVRGVPFSKNVGVRGGYGPYVWSGGNLPPGLSLNSATGEISGTPLTAGTFQGTVQVADPYTTGASKTVTFTIDAIAIATVSLPAGVIQGAYSQTIAVAGGSAPFSWSVTTGSLPPGLAFDAATGTISGRPTATGTFAFTVRVSDAEGWKADKDLRIEVVPWTDKTVAVSWTKSIALDDAGNYYVAGVQESPHQLFAAKYAGSGQLLWQRFTSGEIMTSIAVDTAGNVYAAGYSFSTSKSFVIKYDSNGTTLWTREYDGVQSPMAMALAVDASQNVYVSGRPGLLTPNSSFLIKYDTAGDLKWAKTTLDGQPTGIAVGQDGNVYAVFNSTIFKFDPSGNELWSRSYGDATAGIAIDRNDNVFIAGSSLSKHDAAGNTVWSVRPEGMSISRVTVDSAGNSYLTGNSTSASVDMVTVKYDAAGDLVWRKIYDAGGEETGEAVAVEKNGSTVFVAGTQHKDGMPNLLIVRYLQPAILTASVVNGTVGAPYTQSLAAGAGTAPYTWSVAPGWLPSGLSLDGATGVISGIPWVAGSYTIYVRVTDANGIGDLRIFPVTIDSATAPSLADFTANPVLGQVPVQVTFSDASSNSPTAWSWLLGDGTSGSGKTLTHLYTTPGTYTVSLTTMSENGTQVVTKDAFITVLACSNGTARLALSNAPFASLSSAYLAAQDGDFMMLLAVDTREVMELNRDIKVSLIGGFDCSYSSSPLPTTLAGLRITAGTVKPDNLHLR